MGAKVVLSHIWRCWTRAQSDIEWNKFKARFKRYNLDDDTLKYFKDNLTIESLREEEVLSKVHTLLKKTGLGIDVDVAIELLYWWIFLLSEKGGEITKKSLLDRLNLIGDFVNERKQFHDHFYNSILGFGQQHISEDQVTKLSKEYYAGVSARYDHIVANLDVAREQKLIEVDNAFGNSNVHSVCSKIIADILIDDFIISRVTYFRKCLPLIDEDDLFGFLVNVTSSDISLTDGDLIEYLSKLKFQRWVAIGNITNYLLWYGLRNFVHRYRELLNTAYNRDGSLIVIQVLIDFTNTLDLDNFLSGFDSLRDKLELTSREIDKAKVDKQEVFKYFRAWAEKIDFPTDSV